jgi:hypothetical protein
VVLANRLQEIEVSVRAMLLFDCVDMHAGLDAATIPKNVKNVLHLTRHPDSGSRSSWGNDALWHYPDYTKMERWSYMCTHGALGGVPSPLSGDDTAADLVKESASIGRTNVTYDDDERISAVIWADIQSFCLQHGFI